MGRKVASISLAVGLAVASALPAYAITESVGGGTWVHGTSYTFPTTKNVWSNYVHSTKNHSSTAICGSHIVKATKDPGVWSYATAHCNINQTANAYWNTW